MKSKILFLLLCVFSLGVMGQNGKTQGTITRKKPKTEGSTGGQDKQDQKTDSNSNKKKTQGSSGSRSQGSSSSRAQSGGNHPAPEAAGYDVTFSCNVSSASLYIDGTANGTASGTRFLKTGNHSVSVTASGYNDYTGSITVNRQNTSCRFTLEKKPEPSRPVATTTGTHRGHEWVDLGLPSGTKWATMNVGASSSSDYGNYYAWGETSTKSSYDWSNLRYWTTGDSGDNVKFSKYVTDSKYGNVDGKKELDLSDDAAYVNWGTGWRMPSKAQQDELREKCTWTWTSMGGHNGCKVVGPNGSSLFLPAAGGRNDSSSDSFGASGDYWSRTLFTSYGHLAYILGFYSGDVGRSITSRYCGRSVRPVLAP
ncbi:MAG: PEGA domain-containing protein [Bacteroidales bacterium]|nr:PEGA domain-containing protein [Bacteroidales bacterium]